MPPSRSRRRRSAATTPTLLLRWEVRPRKVRTTPPSRTRSRFRPAAATATITIPVIDDAVVEPTETVTVSLRSPAADHDVTLDANPANLTATATSPTTTAPRSRSPGRLRVRDRTDQRHVHGHADGGQFHRYGGRFTVGGTATEADYTAITDRSRFRPATPGHGHGPGDRRPLG